MVDFKLSKNESIYLYGKKPLRVLRMFRYLFILIGIILTNMAYGQSVKFLLPLHGQQGKDFL